MREAQARAAADLLPRDGPLVEGPAMPEPEKKRGDEEGEDVGNGYVDQPVSEEFPANSEGLEEEEDEEDSQPEPRYPFNEESNELD